MLDHGVLDGMLDTGCWMGCWTRGVGWDVVQGVLDGVLGTGCWMGCWTRGVGWGVGHGVSNKYKILFNCLIECWIWWNRVNIYGDYKITYNYNRVQRDKLYIPLLLFHACWLCQSSILGDCQRKFTYIGYNWLHFWLLKVFYGKIYTSFQRWRLNKSKYMPRSLKLKHIIHKPKRFSIKNIVTYRKKRKWTEIRSHAWNTLEESPPPPPPPPRLRGVPSLVCKCC